MLDCNSTICLIIMPKRPSMPPQTAHNIPISLLWKQDIPLRWCSTPTNSSRLRFSKSKIRSKSASNSAVWQSMPHELFTVSPQGREAIRRGRGGKPCVFQLHSPHPQICYNHQIATHIPVCGPTIWPSATWFPFLFGCLVHPLMIGWVDIFQHLLRTGIRYIQWTKMWNWKQIYIQNAFWKSYDVFLSRYLHLAFYWSYSLTFEWNQTNCTGVVPAVMNLQKNYKICTLSWTTNFK